MQVQVIDLDKSFTSKHFTINSDDIPYRGTIFKNKIIKGNFYFLIKKGFYEFGGDLKASVLIDCVKCLETEVHSFCIPIRITLTKNKELVNHSKDINDIIYVPCDSKNIDLGPILADIIELSKPMNPVCQEGCKGLCQICGVNRNKLLCSCEPENHSSIWDELKKFKP